MMRHSWVDGQKATSVPLDDRGLNYADGAFETVLCRSGRITCLSSHEERLAAALSALQFDTPQMVAQSLLGEAQRCLLQVEHTGPARLTVTRGSGPRGYAPTTQARPRYILTTSAPSDNGSAAWRCGVATTRWQDQPQFAGLKLLARTEQVLAAREAAVRGWDDVLMLDSQDRVISSGKGNVVLIADKATLTPMLNRSGIAGTRRKILIESVLPTLGYGVEVREISMDDVFRADCVIISNTLVGAVVVASINQHLFTNYDYAFNTIHTALREHIN